MATLIMKHFQTSCWASSLICLLLICSCSKDKSQDAVAPSESAPVVVTLFSPGGLGDVVYEDRICLGLSRGALKNKLRTYNIVPSSVAEGVRSLCGSMSEGNLYVIAGLEYYDKLDSIALLLPDKSDLLYIGQPSDNPKVHTADILTYGLYYSAGVVATELYKGNKSDYDAATVAFDPDNYAYRTAKDAFIAGMKGTAADRMFSIDMDSIIDKQESGDDIYNRVAYIYDQLSLFFVPLQQNMIRVLLLNPDRLKHSFAPGVDIDMSSYNPLIPFSCVRHMDRLSEQCIDQWLSPQGLPACQRYGLDSEYAGIVFSSDYIQLQSVADSIYSEALEKERELAR